MAFEYLNTPYISPIDVQVARQNAELLTEMEREKRVVLPSKIDETIGKMPVNIKETDFKNNLARNIQSKLAQDPSNYANIMEAYNMATEVNPDVKLRIQADKDYNIFLNEVNSNATLPTAYKNWIKEKNPYILGNEDNPFVKSFDYVDNIPLMKHFENAIRNLTRERTGGGSSVRYYDSNGNILKGAQGAISAAYYDTTNSSWKRLSAKEIADAVKQSIEITPGAKESINQDWEYAKDHGLQKDANGFNDSKEQWLDRQINDFAERTEINDGTYSVSPVQMTAWEVARQANKNKMELEEHKAQLKGLGNAIKNGTQTTGDALLDATLSNVAGGAVKAGNIETNSVTKAAVTEHLNNVRGTQNDFLNIISDIVNNKKGQIVNYTSPQQLLDHMRWKYKGNKTTWGPNIAINYFIEKELKGKGINLTSEEKRKLRNTVFTSYQYNQEFKDIINAAGDDKDAVKFVSKINNNGLLDFNEKDTKYEKEMISHYNKLFDGTSNGIDIKIDIDTMKKLRSIYGVTDLDEISKYIKVTNNGNDYNIHVDNGAKSIFPTFALNLYNADINARGDNMAQVFRAMFTGNRNKFTILKNGKEYGTRTGNLNTLRYNPIAEIASIYSEAVSAGNKKLEKMNIAETLMPYETSPYSTFAAMGYDALNAKGFMKRTDADAYMKRAKAKIDNECATANYSDANATLYWNTNQNHAKAPKDEEERELLGNLLMSMYSSKEFRDKVSRRAFVLMDGNVPKDAYQFTISLEAVQALDKKNGNQNNTNTNFSSRLFKNGATSITIISAGVIPEPEGKALREDSQNIVRNVILGSMNTKSSRSVLPYEESGIDTSIKYIGNGDFKLNFGQYSATVDRDLATAYQATLLELQKAKYNLINLSNARKNNEITKEDFDEQFKNLNEYLSVLKNNITTIMPYCDAQGVITSYIAN